VPWYLARHAGFGSTGCASVFNHARLKERLLSTVKSGAVLVVRANSIDNICLSFSQDHLVDLALVTIFKEFVAVLLSEMGFTAFFWAFNLCYSIDYEQRPKKILQALFMPGMAAF